MHIYSHFVKSKKTEKEWLRADDPGTVFPESPEWTESGP